MTTSFPEVRWGRLGSPQSKAAEAFAATRFGSWIVRRLVGLDRWILERSRGRYTALGPFGAPLCLLVTVGRRSGRTVVTPLLYIRDGNGLVLVGSNFGRNTHPDWSSNLLAQPDAAVIMAGVTIPVRATTVAEDKKDRLWAKFIETTRVYTSYRQRTDRDMRMFTLAEREKE